MEGQNATRQTKRDLIMTSSPPRTGKTQRCALCDKEGAEDVYMESNTLCHNVWLCENHIDRLHLQALAQGYAAELEEAPKAAGEE